jgi:aminoglycoside 3-N-acetyltransferase
MYTKQRLIDDFRQIPLTTSRVIIVHSSYKSLGGVAGGAQTVIDALLEWVGPEGTVLFPTFNFQSWSETHYFDIEETHSQMGIIGELGRLRRESIRTPHPMYSFAALGQENGALDIKFEPPCGQYFFDRALNAGFFPQPLEDNRRPDFYSFR